ncbi:MAG: response regulator [Candidatus Parabeggiatoa sp. nov. 3]|jgi:DNA-binding response OmpR family regulator|nr:MAG: response regulator [Gammaproteobacteria bacterium]RKZ63723.1 MAG: response regulator [Gammaproteobacteria bacterium]RKZ84573.1 MAG: response regulator [Gammaproteobacteria bacterium]HEW98595.1 response regulator [Beggiatoa sp.]
MNILFVENHVVFAKIVTETLLNQHTVTIVSTLSKAWALISQEDYDVILVDFDLDDGKGDELVKKIRAQNWPVKIVAVSSHDRGNLALQKAGADAICGKLSFREIEAVIEQVMKQKTGMI